MIKRKLNIGGNWYNSFVFSKDSNDVCGYIRFDSGQRQFYFLSKYFKVHEKDICKNANKSQKLFSLFKSKSESLCYIGDLGSDFNINTDSGGNNCFTMDIIYSFSLPSDRINDIRKIEFCGNLFPEMIQVYDYRP